MKENKEKTKALNLTIEKLEKTYGQKMKKLIKAIL